MRFLTSRKQVAAETGHRLPGERAETVVYERTSSYVHGRTNERNRHTNCCWELLLMKLFIIENTYDYWCCLNYFHLYLIFFWFSPNFLEGLQVLDLHKCKRSGCSPTDLGLVTSDYDVFVNKKVIEGTRSFLLNITLFAVSQCIHPRYRTTYLLNSERSSTSSTRDCHMHSFFSSLL